MAPYKSLQTKKKAAACKKYLIAFIIVLFLFYQLPSAFAFKVTPEQPVKGDKLKLTDSCTPGEKVPVSINFTKVVGVDGGSYEYDLGTIKLPTDSTLSVKAENVKDLTISVKMLIWISITREGKDGTASYSRNMGKGDYRIKLSGNAIDGAENVKLNFKAESSVECSQEGDFEYTYDSAYLPAGDYTIKVGGETEKSELLSEEPPEPVKESFTALDDGLLNDVFKAKGLRGKNYVKAPSGATASLLSIAEKSRSYPFFERLVGIVDRKPEKLSGGLYEMTASRISREYSWTQNLILARGDLRVDSYAALALARQKRAPVALTTPEKLPQETSQLIDRLNPTRVIIIGGPEAVSKNVVEEVQQGAEVERLWGKTRIETSVELAKQFNSPEHIVVAGWNSSESAAYMSYLYKAPVVYVREGELPGVVEDYLSNQMEKNPEPKIIFVNVGSAVKEEIKRL